MRPKGIDRLEKPFANLDVLSQACRYNVDADAQAYVVADAINPHLQV